MTLAVRQLVERRIGLDPESLGQTVFAAAIAERCEIVGTDPVAYAGLLERDAKEFDRFVNRLVVAETWFFRGGGLFEFIARRAVELGRTVRILSLPCSTGEEPYSLAIAFTDAGVPAEHWTIDGIDLSLTAITVARRGVYREFSFRQTPMSLRERYFQKVEGGWELNAAIRDRVRFRVGNVLNSETLNDGTVYDVILCRNLLIYLTPDGRRRALDQLDQVLAPDGWLGVGHAEPAALGGRGFGRVGPEELFLFTRAADGVPDVGTDQTLSWAPVKPVVLNETVARMPMPSRPVTEPQHPPLIAEPLLVRARQLADMGRLDDALAKCQSALAVGPSADGYALLGLIQQARGETHPAAESFRRALYLAPDHPEALANAMLLCEMTGNVSQAGIYRTRLARLTSGDRP